MDKKILITHQDLDGAGCAIIFKRKYPKIEVQYHDYQTITEISQKLLKEKDQYKKIYFADISPESKEGEQMRSDEKFVIIDHHKTREYLQSPAFNFVFDTCYSATKLVYNILYPIEKFQNNNVEANEFILSVDAWDAWKLKSPYRKLGEDLNLLFGYYGMDEFVEKFKDMRRMIEKEKTMIQIIYKLKNDYLKHKIEQCKTKIDENGNKYWEVYIGESQSGLGNLLEMADGSVGIKYLKCINLNDRVVSLYSLGFDVTEIAKEKGGGGHAQASGYTLKCEKKNNY